MDNTANNSSPLRLSAAARVALKRAIRRHPRGKMLSQERHGTPDVSTLPANALLALGLALGIDPTTLQAVADTSGETVPAQPAPEAPALPAVASDTADPIDAQVRALLDMPYAKMPEALRDIVVKANRPPEVREVVKEVTVEVPVRVEVPVLADGKPAYMSTADYSMIKPVREDSAHRVFDSKTDILRDLKVAVWNDPTAPAIDPDYEFNAETTALLVYAQMSPKTRTVFLTGHRGTGKSSLARQLAARTGRHFAHIAFRRDTEAAELIGGVGIASANEGGGTKHEDGALTAAIRRPGTVVLLDEPDIAKAGATFFLQTLLEERTLLIERTGEVVRVAPGVQFIVAANTRGHGDETGVYVDRNLMDSSTLDRCSLIIPMQYLPRQKEIDLIRARTGCPLYVAETVVDFMRLTRTRSEKEADIAAPMGMRRALDLAALLSFGRIVPRQCFEVAVFNHFNREESEVLRQLYSTINEAALLDAVHGRTKAPDKAGASAEAGKPDII